MYIMVTVFSEYLSKSLHLWWRGFSAGEQEAAHPNTWYSWDVEKQAWNCTSPYIFCQQSPVWWLHKGLSTSQSLGVYWCYFSLTWIWNIQAMQHAPWRFYCWTSYFLEKNKIFLNRSVRGERGRKRERIVCRLTMSSEVSSSYLYSIYWNLISHPNKTAPTD